MVNFSPMVVNLLGFKINVVDRAAVVNIGPIQQVDFFLSTKRNQGFGENNGDLSPVNIPITAVADPDFCDSPSVKNSFI